MSAEQPTHEELLYLAQLDVVRGDGFDRTSPALARMVLALRRQLEEREPPNPEFVPPGQHYVVVVERDMDGVRGEFDAWGMWHDRYPDMLSGPIVWETYLTGGASFLNKARERVRQLRGAYGRTVVARLVFDVDAV